MIYYILAGGLFVSLFRKHLANQAKLTFHLPGISDLSRSLSKNHFLCTISDQSSQEFWHPTAIFIWMSWDLLRFTEPAIDLTDHWLLESMKHELNWHFFIILIRYEVFVSDCRIKSSFFISALPANILNQILEMWLIL